MPPSCVLAVGCLAFALIACGGDSIAPAAPLPARTLQVSNFLVQRVAITVDGVAFGGLAAAQPGAPTSTIIAVPGDARLVGFTTVPFQFSDGSAVPGDLVGNNSMIGAASSVGINNVLAGVRYIAFRVLNTSGSTKTIGIVSSEGSVRCLGFLPHAAGQAYGYYPFGATTEVRAYAGGGGCIGAYLIWPNNVLATFDPNSGFIALVATQ